MKIGGKYRNLFFLENAEFFGKNGKIREKSGKITFREIARKNSAQKFARKNSAENLSAKIGGQKSACIIIYRNPRGISKRIFRAHKLHPYLFELCLFTYCTQLLYAKSCVHRGVCQCATHTLRKTP